LLVRFVDEPDAGTVSAHQITRKGGMQADEGRNVLFTTDTSGMLQNDARNTCIG